LPEVVGSAGMLVPASDASAWLGACLRLFRDELLRRRLSALGRERSERYSWLECARQTLQAYHRAI
jgi:glycosyltransferase involved in cell wall biosynthesis